MLLSLWRCSRFWRSLNTLTQVFSTLTHQASSHAACPFRGEMIQARTCYHDPVWMFRFTCAVRTSITLPTRGASRPLISSTGGEELTDSRLGAGTETAKPPGERRGLLARPVDLVHIGLASPLNMACYTLHRLMCDAKYEWSFRPVPRRSRGRIRQGLLSKTRDRDDGFQPSRLPRYEL